MRPGAAIVTNTVGGDELHRNVRQMHSRVSGVRTWMHPHMTPKTLAQGTHTTHGMQHTRRPVGSQRTYSGSGMAANAHNDITKVGAMPYTCHMTHHTGGRTAPIGGGTWTDALRES